MYKGIGPNKLGSPLKQTTKKYPDLPSALTSDAAKKDFKQFEQIKKDVDSSPQPLSSWGQRYRVGTDSTGHYKHHYTVPEPGLTPSYPETFFMGGAILKGVGGLFKGAQPAFNLAKSTAPAWKSAATTVAGAVGDEVIMGGVDYIISGNEPSNNTNNKNKKNKK